MTTDYCTSNNRFGLNDLEYHIMQHLQPNTTLLGGKYRIERVLGYGGFGNTYVGYNTEFEETVAIKEFFIKGVTERDKLWNKIASCTLKS